MDSEKEGIGRDLHNVMGDLTILEIFLSAYEEFEKKEDRLQFMDKHINKLQETVLTMEKTIKKCQRNLKHNHKKGKSLKALNN